MSLNASDRLDIHELYARYALYFDNGNPQAWANVFSEGGRFVLEDHAEIVGRADLATFAQERMERSPGIRHYTTNICIDDTEQGVRGQAYALVVCKRPGDVLRLRTMGSYEDQLVREGGTWQFLLRRYIPWIAPEEAGRAFSFEAPIP